MAVTNTTITRRIGPVSAYAIAVSEGYTGTQAQWAAEIANASINAQTASTAAASAVQAKDAAVAAKNAAEAAAVHEPTIGQNGNWQIWDQAQGQYVDSGVSAESDIDDTAGAGDTTKTYSADKLTTDLANKADKTNTVLLTTLSRGRKADTTIGNGSFAFGNNVEASGQSSYAEGTSTTSSGNSSHAEGTSTIASNNNSHAEGMLTTASGAASHAEGTLTEASGMYSHAEGRGTSAPGHAMHVSGLFNTIPSTYPEWVANTSYSVGDLVTRNMSGYQCIEANSDTTFTSSKWQTITFTTDEIFVVGNGSRANARSNAMTLKRTGDVEFSGDIYSGQNKVPTVDKVPVEYGTGAGSVKIKNTVIDGTTVPQIASGQFSVSLGKGTVASGDRSFATGYSNISSGEASFTEGAGNTASGRIAHAEGSSTTASGDYSHSEGHFTTASGSRSHTEGRQTTASASYSHAEGYRTTASGSASHSEGRDTIANGYASHVGGKYNIADSHDNWPEWAVGSYVVGDKVKVTSTENNETIVKGYICNTDNNDAEFTVAHWTEDKYINYAVIIGNGSDDHVRSNAYTLDWEGNGWFAGDISGTSLNLTGTVSRGRKSNTTIGTASFAFGHLLTASGVYSHAEGNNTSATGVVAHTEGVATTASGTGSHAEGWIAVASGDYSHAEGRDVTASGEYSHVEGLNSTASGTIAHAEGNGTQASGVTSHAEGLATIASSDYQHAQGKYNIADNNDTYAHIVGNGTVSTRSNAHTLDWNGNAWYAGKVSVGTVASHPAPTAANDLVTKDYVDTSVAGAGAVQDVQVNGGSVLSNGVANIPVATSSAPGVVRIHGNGGLQVMNTYLMTSKALESDVKAGSNNYKVIVPTNEHSAAFYGLAKAAGDTTQASSDNAVGVYTAEAKTAIQTMLGIGSSSSTSVVDGMLCITFEEEGE